MLLFVVMFFIHLPFPKNISYMGSKKYSCLVFRNKKKKNVRVYETWGKIENAAPVFRYWRHRRSYRRKPVSCTVVEPPPCEHITTGLRRDYAAIDGEDDGVAVTTPATLTTTITLY